MPIEFELNTAKIVIDQTGANTHVTPFKPSGGTETFMLFDMKRGTSTLVDGHRFAFTLVGTITLKKGFEQQLNELARWNFGFLQFWQQKVLKITYLGRTQLDGHIEVDVGRHIGTAFILDKLKAPPMPFVNKPVPGTQEADGAMRAEMGDHPFVSVKQKLRNKKTGAINTLFRMEYEARFISTFIGQDPAKTLHHFANVEWTLSYSSAFRINAGKPEAIERHGGIRFGAVQMGVNPSAPATPAPPLGNEVAERALKQSFLPGNPARFDQLFYPPSAPENFVFEINPKKT